MVNTGLVIIEADALPMFLYDESKLDPEKLNAGLFSSPYLIAVSVVPRCDTYLLTIALQLSRGLGTGPKSATKETPGPATVGRASISKLRGQTHITKGWICYVACLVSTQRVFVSALTSPTSRSAIT